MIAISMNRSQDVREVQTRLSILGLVAHGFVDIDFQKRAEKIEDLFEEGRSGEASAVVAIDRESEWRYRKLQKSQGTQAS